MALVSLAALTLSVGCANNFRKQDAAIDGKTEMNTLIVEYKAGFGEVNQGVIGALFEVGSRGVINDVGKQGTEKIQSLLARLGFVSAFDAAAFQPVRDDLMVDVDLGAHLSGRWVHPDTALLSVDSGLFGRQYLVKPEQVVASADPDKKYTHFAFVDVLYYDDSVVNVVNWPRAVLNIIVYDDAGNKVMDAGAEGTGESGFFMPNREESALVAALDGAIAKLETLPSVALSD